MPQQLPTVDPAAPKAPVDTSLNALRVKPTVAPATKAIAQATATDPKALRTDLNALKTGPQLAVNQYKRDVPWSPEQSTAQSDYLTGLVQGQNPEELKAANQGFWTEMGNAALQTVAGTVLDFAEGVGYLGVGELVDKARGVDQEFGNSFSSKMEEWNKQFKENIAPIYVSQNAQGFSPGNSEWWASNIPSIASAVSLLFPARGATWVLGKAGRMMGGLKLAKALGIGADAIKAGEAITMAGISRHMEGMMEGMEVYETLHKRAIDEGRTEEEAATIAGKGASDTYVKNLPLVVGDILQFGLAFKSFGAMSRAMQVEKGSKNIIGKLATQMATESFEEGYQSVVSKEAERTALIEGKVIKDDYTTYGERLMKYVADGDVQTAAFFGAFGGAVFEGGGSGIEAYETRAAAKEKLKNKVEESNLEKATATYKKDPIAFARSVDTDIIDLTIESIQKGEAHKIEELFKIMQDGKHQSETVTEENENEIKLRAGKAIEDLKQLEQVYNNVFKDPTKMQSPELASFELTNRGRALTDGRLHEKAKVAQGTVLDKIAKERNLDPTYSSLLKGEVELSMLYNEFKDTSVDKEIREGRITALQDEITAIRNTIKTNNPGLTDKGIDAKLAINKGELATASFHKILFDLGLAQINKDFDKLQTNEGRKEVQKEIKEFQKQSSNKELLKLTGKITYQSTFKELSELKAAAKKMGKLDEFTAAFNEKVEKIKIAAPEYDPADPATSLTGRFAYSPLLSEYETGEITKMADATNAQLAEFTPDAIAKEIRSNPAFAAQVENYFAATDELEATVPNKKSAKDTPIRENKDEPGKDNGVTQPEISSVTGNKSAWDLAGQQFAMQTTFEGDDKITYSQDEANVKDGKNNKFYAVVEGKEKVQITREAYAVAFKQFSQPDPSKPLTDNMATKMTDSGSWTFLNQGKLPKNAKLHVEYDLEDSWNTGGAVKATGALTPHNALFEFAYYIDGNNGNKQIGNRMIVGFMPAYYANGTYTDELEKAQLKALRERLFQEVMDTGYKTGVHTTTVTTEAERVRGGRYWKGESGNPLDKLRPDQKLVLAIGERFQLKDGSYSVKLNTNGHAWQDRIGGSWKVEAGMLYMLIEDAGGYLVPYKMWTKALKEKPGTADIIVEEIKRLGEAKTGEEKLQILADIREHVYVKNIDFVDGEYLITTGNVESSKTRNVKEEGLKSIVEELIFQVDINKINKVTTDAQGKVHNYNEDISNRELISCDVHAFTQFHSAKVVIKPIETAGVVIAPKTDAEMPTVSTSASTGPPVTTSRTGLEFTLPPQGKPENIAPAHFTTVKEAADWLRPEYESQRTSRPTKDRTPVNAWINRKYTKLLATYSNEAREIFSQAVYQLMQEEVATTPFVAETGAAKVTEPVVAPVVATLEEKKVEAAKPEVVTPTTPSTPSIPASAPKRQMVRRQGVTGSGAVDAHIPEQVVKQPMVFDTVPGLLDFTRRGIYNTQMGFVVIFEPNTNPADTVSDTYPTEEAARIAAAQYKNKIENGKARKVEEIGAYSPLNEEQVHKWFEKNLSQIKPTFVKQLIEMSRNGGTQAWGVFFDNAIQLFEGAPKGTEHHEAFHAVFRLLLNKEQREQILNEASAKYKIPRSYDENATITEEDYKETNDYAIEEKLADAFIQQVQEDFATVETLGGQIAQLFKGWWESFKALFSKDLNIESLFLRINTGFYKNKKLHTGTTNRRYRPVANPYKTTRNTKYINYLFFQALGKYKEQNKLGDISDAEVVRHISSNARKGILGIYENVYTTITNRANEYFDAGIEDKYNELCDILDEFMTLDENGKVTETNWYYTQAIRDLNKFGIKATSTQIRDNQVDSERDDKQFELNEEEVVLESWQRAAVETNQKESLSYGVRKALRLSTKYKIKPGEVFEENKDVYDIPEFVDFDETYNYLQVNLAGTLNIDNMLRTMEELKYHRPDLYGILRKLEKDPSLKSQFFANFSQVYKAHMQVMQFNNRQTGQDGQTRTFTTYRVYNANRKNLHQLILNQWDEGLSTPELNDVTDSDGKIIKSKAQAYFKEYEEVVARMRRTKRVRFEDNVILAGILKKFGMVIDPQALQKEYREKSRIEGKKEITTDPYDSYMGLVDGTKSIKTVLQRIASGDNPFVGESSETSSAKHVTRVISLNTENLHQDTFINGDGKQVYSYTLPTFLDKKIQEFKDNENRKGYLNNWWFKRNKWLQDLDDPTGAELLKEFDVVLADSIRLDGRQAKKYYDMTDYDLDATDLNMYDMNGSATYAYYRLPILSDSPQAPYAKFKKYSELEVVDALYQLALAEKDRILMARVSAGEIDIKNWNSGLNNGLKYNFMTVFNNTDIDIANEAAAKKAITEWMNAEGKIEQSRLIENGILKSDGKFDRTVSDKANNPAFFRGYFYNKFLATAMMTQLFGVDLAYYKNGEDFQKRFGQVFKFTKMIDVTAVSKDGTAVGASYNVIYMKDNIIKSEMRGILKADLLGKGYSEEYAETQAALFDEVNQTDAQTYITLERHKKIQIGLGQWPDEKEAAYQAIQSGKPYDPKLELIFGPQKPFYYGHEIISSHDNKNDIVLPVQHKNSEVVLFRGVANRSEQLKDMLEQMERRGKYEGTGPKIDAALFNSAVKTGEYGTAKDVADIANATIHVMDNKYFGIQQETPEHHLDTDNTIGSQLKKLMPADIPDIDPKTGKPTMIGGFTKAQIFSLYNRLIVDNMKESYEQLAKELGNIDKVHEILLNEIVERELGEFYEIAIELRDDMKGDKVFNLPLFHPTHAKRFEQILNAIVRNRVVKQKINGGSFALMSNFGFTDKLKIHRDKDGGITHMDCMLPAWSKEWFENYRNKNGEVDIARIQKEAPEILDLFGYRIPTEHKYSMKNLRVVGFLPDIMGGAIMLPAEITKISGEDFDIDKLYVMIPNIRNVYNWGELSHDFNLQHDFLTWRDANGYPGLSLKEIREIIEEKIEDDSATEAEQLFYKQFNDFARKGKSKYFEKIEKIGYGGLEALMKEPEVKPAKIDEVAEAKVLEEVGVIVIKSVDGFSIVDVKNPTEIFATAKTQKEADAIAIERNESILATRRMLMEDEVVETKLSKKQRDNALIDLMRLIWSSPVVSDQVTNPGGSGTLKDLAIEKRKERGIDENANPLLPRTQMKYFQGNTSGSQLIGIGANHNVNHAIAQYSELALTKEVLINNEKLTKLNRQKTIPSKDAEQVLISRNLAEFLTAFVDNAKDPIAGDLNINTFTFDTVAMLTRLGLDLKTVTDFITQPVIEHFAKEFFRAGGGRNAEKAVYDQILEDLYKNRKLTTEKKAHNINVPLLTKTDNNNPSTYNDQVAEEQLRVLYSFMTYKNQADSLAKFVRATRNDSLGTRKTMAGNTKAMMDMEKALEDKNLVGVDGIIRGDNYPMIRDGTEYGLSKPQRELLDKLFPYFKIAYRELYRKLEANKDSDLTEDEINYVNNLTLVYFGTGFQYFNLNEKNYWINDYPKEFKASLYQKVVGENVSEVKDKFKQYDLLKYLKFQKADEEGGIDRIEFISGATMSNAQREYVTRSWEAMLVSDDTEVQSLAKELIQYSFHTNGLTFSFMGFSHLIPTNHLDKLTDPIDATLNFRDYLYKLQDVAKNPKFFDNFIEQMFRHDVKRWGLLPQKKEKDIIVKNGKKYKDGVISSVTLNRDQVSFDEDGMVGTKYFKMWNAYKNMYYTYKYVGVTPSNDFVFNVLPPLGSSSNIYEYDVSNPGITSVIKTNGLPDFKESDYFPTIDQNDPGEEFDQIAQAKTLEIKFGLVDGNNVHKNYGSEGNTDASRAAYGKAYADTIRINKEALGSGYKAIIATQADGQGGNNIIVRMVDELYDVEEQKLAPDNQLNVLLRERMTELGISIEDYDDFIDRMGHDIAAVSNAFQKVIKVSKRLETEKSLPEEVGHIAEGYNKGTAAHNRLMQLIVYTPEYAEAVRDYSEKYKGDDIKLRREAIGKLIGNTIINQNREGPVSPVVRTFLQRIWDRFLSIFTGVNQYKVQNEINAITGKYATDVIEGHFDTWNKTVEIDEEFYQLSTAPAEEARDLLMRSIDSIYKKIKIYERKSLKSFTEREKEIYNELSISLKKEQYKEGLLSYVVNAAQEMQKVVDRYEKMVHDPKTIEDKRDTIKTLKQMNNYVNGFRDVLNEISKANAFGSDTAALKNLNRFIDTTAAMANKLESEYYNVGKPILKDILREFSTNPNVDIGDALDVLERDISWGNRMLDELASSGEPVLKVIDKMVKEHKNIARLKTVKVSKELLQLQKDLEKAGIPTTHFMYERDYDGKLTGNILSEFNEGQLTNERRAFFKANPKPKDPQSKDQATQRKYKAEMKAWSAKVGIWFQENMQPHKDKQKIMDAKRAEMVAKYGTQSIPDPSNPGKRIALAEVRYNEWYGENAFESTYFNHQTGEPDFTIRYRKELATPAEKYKNEIYRQLYPVDKDGNPIDVKTLTPQQKAMRKYHENATRILDELDKELPEYYKLDGMAPQVRKDFFERMTVTDATGNKSFKSLKQIGKDTGTSIAEQFIVHENDVEYGLTDENNQPVNLLPVRFARRLQNTSDMSLDLTSSLIAFAYSANDFSEMNKIVDVLEFTKDVIGERKVHTGKFDPVTTFKNEDSKGRPIMIDGKKSMAYERLEDWMQMVVYGHSSKKEGAIFGLDKGKLVDFVNSYTALASLALNLYSGISNITVGYAMTKMEAVSGEFFNNTDARWADKTYAGEMPGVLADIGQRLSDSKLDLWLEHMNTMQNYDRDYRNVDAARNTLFSRLMKTSSLFFMSHAGEHLIQSRLSLALAHNTRVKDKDGKEMSLWDAFEVDGNVLKMKEGLTKVAGKKTTHLFKKEEDGQPLTEKDVFRFINRQNFLNKRLHGIYNDVDKMAAQQYALGRLTLMFRKFIIPGWNRRFSKLTYNEEGEAFTEGYYRTLGRFLGLVDQELGEAKLSLGMRWEKLTDADKANFHRLLTEWAFMIGSVVVGGVLTQFAGDDEDDYLMNLAAYEAYRTYSEIRFFTSFTEMWRIVKSPAPSMYTVDKLIKFLEFWHWNEKLERGPYKGYTKFTQGLTKVLPLSGTVINILTPEEQLKFYTNNKVSWF